MNSAGTIAQVSRLRVISSRETLARIPISAQELRKRVVLVKSGSAGEGNTLDVFRRVVPWFEFWYNHPSWRTGVWRCEINAELQNLDYTAYQPSRLGFHNDMTRYVQPPEYTAIRCISADRTGGENLHLHVDDVIQHFRKLGRQDILGMLFQLRPLSAEGRHLLPGMLPSDAIEKAMLVEGDEYAPSRVFDRHAASKGAHLVLSDNDAQLYDEFLATCNQLDDVTVRVRLEPGDLVLFSNWRFLHSRTECEGSGRVTEICMGGSGPRQAAQAG